VIIKVIRSEFMICITGDLHGDLSRLGHKNIKKLKKGDSLIICGDFGCIWDGSSKENSTLKALGKKKYNILFVDGCHENFDLLESYPIEEWNGGKTRVISGNLRQLMRGELFDIDGKKIFAFGGGQSEDKDIKKEQNNWWENETPTEEEIENAIDNLLSAGNKVDYIVTHEPPATLKEFLQVDTKQKSEMGAYFDKLKDSCEYIKWFFGKCHINRSIPPKYQAVFDEAFIIE